MAHHPDPSRERGFSTRAIRAATPPTVTQRPDSVPIYQAVTFSAADSDELADIVTDNRPADFSQAMQAAGRAVGWQSTPVPDPEPVAAGRSG